MERRVVEDIMERVWWEQVGPRRFCLEVIRCLRITSVAACFPRFSVENLVEGLEDALDDIEFHLDADDDPSPAVVVRAHIECDILDPIESLLGKRGLIIVKNLKPSNWSSWSSFVENYHRRLSAQSPFAAESIRFLLLCRGIAEDALRPYGVDLKIILYKGRVGLLDTEQYCAFSFGIDNSNITEQRVKAAVIAQLALGDKGLADWLCDKDLSSILSPLHILKKLADQRRISVGTARSWHSGTEDMIEGKVTDSSLLLAATDDGRGLDNRIWKAQLKVLFPYIEERRCEFVTLIRDHLSLPREANLSEFEFARLAWFIGEHQKKEEQRGLQTYIDIAGAFGKVRNCLAHQKHAPGMLLQRMFQASVQLDDLIDKGPIKAKRDMPTVKS
jgi:hypothetical protein